MYITSGITINSNPEKTHTGSKAQRNPTNISAHIHRIGYHFRNAVVELACSRYGYRSQGQDYYSDHHHDLHSMAHRSLEKSLQRHGERLGIDAQDEHSHRRSEQVAATVRELFPKIPEDELNVIVTRSFEQVSRDG